MANVEMAAVAASTAQVLPGFQPLQSLWEGDSPPFPSENAVRWLIRQQRQALIEVGALALHLGCTVVHRERFLEVARRQAIESYKQRHAA
jgi:hypothetical protein